ncbi:FliH/SctL family protein [Burkholderia stagnalis]|uniref:FliH/SctL family protein n=1 Tax=Burkholderia stagnalis TaxID=1503054 RepID=UPI000F5E1BA1|nr:hypothetical protein [Burkholderia stagnalis]RQX94962.1 hypothetical protein DF119_22505 [Burkholderia stagnalis]RQY32514.1 hypothetical protein DF116_26760 [Burkholderia stagnalis]RQY56614.1 hypothetical protein DF111_12455 [Burkholderia stagnalis]RQY86388.1 hypothetical protein DF108_12270 [Burkholderia stagnalis]
MTTVIKAGHVLVSADRLPLVAPRARLGQPSNASHDATPQPSSATNGDNPLAQEREQLLTRIAALEAALADRDAGLEPKMREAFATGVENGRAQAIREEGERIAALNAAAAAAREDFVSRMVAIDKLAVELALTGLERVLGDTARYATLIGETIRHRLESTVDGSIIAIRVSAADFDESAQLADLAGTLGIAPSITLVADTSLPAGACFFDLTLGKLDASIPHQMRNIAASLREVCADD